MRDFTCFFIKILGFSLSFISPSLISENYNETTPFIGIESMDIMETLEDTYSLHPSIKYTSPSWIGNRSGYTTLQLLLTPSYIFPKWQLVADLRGHLFDQGHFVINAGIGARCPLSDKAIFGANLYYDYRNALHSKQGVHQLGIGFEWLSSLFDLRGNAYCPLNHSQQSDFCLAGGDLEVGLSCDLGMDINRMVDLYLAAGPYYYSTDRFKGITGGKFRLNISFNDYIFVEGRIGYDHYFHTFGQGVISIEIPLSHFCSFFYRTLLDDAETAYECLRRKILAAPFRNEIIPFIHH